MKPVGLEKHEFWNQIESILQTILAFMVRQDSNAGTELSFSTQYYSKSTNNSIATFTEVIEL